MIVVLCPTAAATTCRSSTTTSGCASTACSATTGAAVRVGDVLATATTRRAELPDGRPGAHHGPGRRRHRPRSSATASARCRSPSAEGDDRQGHRRLHQRDGPARARLPRSRRSWSGRSARSWTAPLPTLDVAATLDEAFEVLAATARSALVATRGDRPAGVITKSDLLEYLAHHPTQGPRSRVKDRLT